MAGDLRGGMAAARAGIDDDLLRDTHITASRLVQPLVLTGRFRDAIGYAARMWDQWERAGRPAPLWMLPAVCTTVLACAMIEEPEKRALFSALFGIFAFLDVPLVYFSIRWWRTQHPQPVILGGPGSGLEPRMRVSYLLMWGALTGLLILLLSARYRLEALRASVEDLRREAEVR